MALKKRKPNTWKIFYLALPINTFILRTIYGLCRSIFQKYITIKQLSKSFIGIISTQF